MIQLCLEAINDDDIKLIELKRLLLSKNSRIKLKHDDIENDGFKTLKQQRKDIGDIIIRVDIDNNLYHKILPQFVANFILKVLLSNFYTIYGAFIMFLFFIYTIIIWSTHFYSDIIWNVLSILLTMWIIPHICAFNIELMRETIKTFDFWYKLFQVIGLSISTPFLFDRARFNIYSICSFWLFNLCGSTWILFFEAWNTGDDIKITLNLMIICWMFTMSGYVFVAFPNVIYDPFDGIFGENKTVINWKEVFLSAYTVLAIFVFKSIFFGVLSHFKNPHLKKRKLRKSIGLAIRPLIKWEQRKYRHQQINLNKHIINNNNNNKANGIELAPTSIHAVDINQNEDSSLSISFNDDQSFVENIKNIGCTTKPSYDTDSELP